MSDKIAQYGTDTVIDFFLEPAGLGHARAVLRARSSTSTGARATATYVGVFSYAGMPYDEAERNMRLFAAEVMPAVQKLGRADPGAPEPAAAGAREGVRALGF